MKLTALSIALIAALGVTAGCGTQTVSQVSRTPAVAADADAQYALGRYYQGQQRYELSIAAYRLALAANPAHAGAHNGLGASLLLSGRNAEAVEQFKAGLKHHPRSAALWNNLGYAYSLSGENRLAEIAYKESLELDPADAKTHTNLAMVQQTAPLAAAATVVTAPPPAASSPEPAQAIAAKPAPEPPKAREAEPAQPAVVIAASQANPAPAPVAANPAPAAKTVIPPVAVSAQAQPVVTQAMPAPVADSIQAKSAEPAGAGAATAASTVQIAQIAPRVFELNLEKTGASTSIPVVMARPAATTNTNRLSVPLREDTIQLASVSSDNFVLEIRNGNGVRRLAWRTSQYLAEHGYTTKSLTNQRGFNVKVTRIFHLPGYLADAQKLLSHLPKDTVITETSNLRRGIHVRVVLGKDMVQHQAGLDAAQAKIRLAAL